MIGRLVAKTRDQFTLAVEIITIFGTKPIDLNSLTPRSYPNIYLNDSINVIVEKDIR